MADTTLPGVLLEGDHASRPAATAVATGTLYACSTHGLIYQSDGSSWSTWATLGGDVSAHTGDTSDAHDASSISFTPAGSIAATDVQAAIEEVASEAGGGGGWTNAITESGGSIANFTSESGTWAVNSGVIRQSGTGASHKRIHHNTLVPLGASVVIEVDIRVNTTGSGVGADIAAGILIGHPGSNSTAAVAVALEPNSDTVQVERSGVLALDTMAITLNLDTYYTLRVVTAGGWVSVYVDGTLLGSSFVTGDPSGDANYVGFVAYDANADFRNFDVWHLTLP